MEIDIWKLWSIKKLTETKDRAPDSTVSCHNKCTVFQCFLDFWLFFQSLADVSATGRGPPERTKECFVGALQPFVNAECERWWGVCSCSHTSACDRPCQYTVCVKLILDKLLFQCYEDVRKTLEMCDIITDNNSFVEMKSTGSTPPGKPFLISIWICSMLEFLILSLSCC